MNAFSSTGPLPALDRDDLRLSSPQGQPVSGRVMLSNRGDAPVDAILAVRLGADWLRVEPATLRVEAGGRAGIAVHVLPRDLPSGVTRGEIEIVTTGGTLTLTVRASVRAGRTWPLFAATLVVCAAIVAAVGIAFSRVTIPVSAPASPAPVTTGHTRGSGHAPSGSPSLSAADLAAARAEVIRAIETSNAAWQSALHIPSTALLASVKTGPDLQTATAEVQDLIAHGERWDIAGRGVRVFDVAVAPDGASATGKLEKTERRALYAPGHDGRPVMDSTATYRLRYHLVRRDGRWLVNTITVESVMPLSAVRPLPDVESVAGRVLPVVVHVEADSMTQMAVGTGIIVRSTAGGSDILTNDHVVQGATTVKVQRWDAQKRTYQPASPWVATRVQEDPDDDLAVIHIAQGSLPAASWADANSLQPGQQVVAIGYAENLAGGPTVTAGLVSSVLRTAPDAPNGPTYIGHSATINHGNSGGPLVDMSGNVVGINTWTLEGTQGLYFAIPSSRALPVVANKTGSNG